MRNKINILILAAASVVLAGCGGGSDKPVTPTTGPNELNISVTADPMTPNCQPHPTVSGTIINLSCTAGGTTGGSASIKATGLTKDTIYTVHANKIGTKCKTPVDETGKSGQSATVVLNYTGCDKDPSGPIIPTAHGPGKWDSRWITGYLRLEEVQDQFPNYLAKTNITLVNTALEKGYKVFIFSFGYQGLDNKVVMQWKDINTGKSVGASDRILEEIPSYINAIHAKGGKVLLSFGGQSDSDTFLPNKDKMADAGTAMGTYLATNKYDGFDMDVEDFNYTMDQYKIYINALKTQYSKEPYSINISKKPIYLTAAPLVKGTIGGTPCPGSWGKLGLAPTDIYTQDFLDFVQFDAILAQTYNQNDNYKICGKQLSSTTKPYLPGTDADKAGIISLTYSALTDKSKGLSSVIMTKKDNFQTKLALGFPAYIDEAYLNAKGPNLCMAAAACSGRGAWTPDVIKAGLQDAYKDSSYGGVMTWAINFDAHPKTEHKTTAAWSWIEGITGK